MQFLTSLFGGSGNSALTAVLALAIVVVLIVLVAWLLKFISKASGNAVRGRNRRLSVMETLAVDQKRQLVIIRRDDVEHLVLIGGPQDVVIETGIAVTEQPAAQPVRRGMPSLTPRRPAAAPAPAPAEAATAPAPTVTAAPGTVLEQLQRAGHSADRKGHVSLRHTGLLRPVRNQDKDGEQKPEISDVNAPDSDKQNIKTELTGKTPLEPDTSTDAKTS